VSVFLCQNHPCGPTSCHHYFRCRKETKAMRHANDKELADAPRAYCCRIHPDVAMVVGECFTCYKCEADMRTYKDLF
jgi:hypothetical protein